MLDLGTSLSLQSTRRFKNLFVSGYQQTGPVRSPMMVGSDGATIRIEVEVEAQAVLFGEAAK